MYNSKVHYIDEAEKDQGTKVIEISNQFSSSLEELNEKVKSMMKRGQNLIPAGKQANGTPKLARAFICKVCGKEALVHAIRDHIEANHLEGLTFPCNHCGKLLSSRGSLSKHKRTIHTKGDLVQQDDKTTLHIF